jgi:hypothetical protein
LKWRGLRRAEALSLVTSSLAVAVMATLVQTQTAVHYGHLAEQVTPSSPLGMLIPTLQAAFMSQGASSSAAYAAAIQEVVGLVQQQATVLAMQDAFRVSMLLTGVAIVAALFVRTRKPQPAARKPASEQKAAAPDEALLPL